MKNNRFLYTLIAVFLMVVLVTPNIAKVNAQAEDFVIELSFTPPKVGVGQAALTIGYVQLLSGETGEPVLAPRNLEIELASRDSNIASVPQMVIIPQGSDYVSFDVTIDETVGATEISALFGDQIVTKNFEVTEARSQIPEDIDLVINLPSDAMQVGSEAPFSVFLENDGVILQAPEDVVVSFDYERSLVKLRSDKMTIKKGDYYAIGTIRSLEKSGTAFIKASTSVPPLDTVTNVDVTQTQPASLRVQVFPEQVAPTEQTIDVFVGLVDEDGEPTLAPEDIHLDMFSSSIKLSTIEDIDAVIKKGEYGFYHRQSMHLTEGDQEISIGATASGLGVDVDTFEVMEEELTITDSHAENLVLQVFSVGDMPSSAESIVVYQIMAVEDDDDDPDFNNDGVFDDGDDVDEDGEFDEQRDHNRDGVIDQDDHNAIDELADGEFYPVQTTELYSLSQGNLEVVSGDNTAARVISTGSISAEGSYGTAIISSGRLADEVGISASLSNVAAGSADIAITGGLNPTQTLIFSPAGVVTDEQGEPGNYRIPFNDEGFSDLFLVTLDSDGRPSTSESGVKYLIRPINELAEIDPGMSFTNIQINSDSFIAPTDIADITATPVGVNSDETLEEVSAFDLIFFTGTTGKVMFPFDNVVGFSKAHPIGVVQLNDQFGNPLVASEDIVVTLKSSHTGAISTPSVTIPQGRSFANFAISTSGKAETITVTSSADGIHSSTTGLNSVLAGLVGVFEETDPFIATIPSSITIYVPEGTSVLWGVPTAFEVVSKDDKAVTYNPSTNSYIATMEFTAAREGEYTIDVTLLKDGFEPAKLSTPVTVDPLMLPLNVFIEYGGEMVKYQQPAAMSILVEDAATTDPVEGAFVTIDAGQAGNVVPSTGRTDATGVVNFVFTPTGTQPKASLTASAEKDGFVLDSETREFEVDGVPTALPFWVTYAAIAGVLASIGGGVVYFMKKPKGKRLDEQTEEEEEEEI